MPDKAKETFAKNLRYLLASNNLTQIEFAEILNLKTSTLSDWINGRKYPRVDSMQLIADYFNIPMSHLMSEDIYIAKKETPATGESLLADYFMNKIGRLPTDDELSRLDDFADTFIKGLDK